jgi:hypothetical protein
MSQVRCRCDKSASGKDLRKIQSEISEDKGVVQVRRNYGHWFFCAY